MVIDIPDRGDLVYLNFDQQTGHEQAGIRPAIVLSPKLFNQATGFVIACPITRKSKGYPFEVPLPNDLGVEGVVLIDQIKSLDWKARKLSVKGKAPDTVVFECINKIKTFIY